MPLAGYSWFSSARVSARTALQSAPHHWNFRPAAGCAFLSYLELCQNDARASWRSSSRCRHRRANDLPTLAYHRQRCQPGRRSPLVCHRVLRVRRGRCAAICLAQDPALVAGADCNSNPALHPRHRRSRPGADEPYLPKRSFQCARSGPVPIQLGSDAPRNREHNQRFERARNQYPVTGVRGCGWVSSHP